MALLLGACGSATGPRHVILISLDTTRADALGCYGNPRARTPRIDQLAAAGRLFEQATTAAPTTLASHTSIFTGLWPHTHGVVRNGFVVNPENRTLAELLRGEGFRTIGCVGSFALDSRFGIDQGFEVWDQDFDVLLDGRGHDQDQRRAPAVTDAVLRHVDDAKGADLFLFVHYFDAHAPHDPPAPFAAGFAREGGPTTSGAAEIEAAVRAQQQRAIGRELGQEAVIRGGLPLELLAAAPGTPLQLDQDLEALYLSEVAAMDQEIGRLLDGLRERGILEDALVVLLADHGETFAEHGDFWNHGLWVYETTARVPLILSGADLAPGRERAPVSTLDVLPTVLDHLGLEAPREAQGRSLLRAVDGERPIFCEATQPPAVERPAAWGNAHKPRCVRLGRWKLVRAPYLGLEQLFDLESDPGERIDLLLSGSAPADAPLARLRAELDAWESQSRPRASAFDRSQLDETIERLRALGYVGGAESGR
jgi:arylsulfatase A-like enzyme